MNLEGIIFDQDGVLIDSEPIHFLAIRDYMQDLGYEYTMEINNQFFGHNAKSLYTSLKNIFACSLSVEELTHGAKAFMPKHEHKITPMPGLSPLLEKISQQKVIMGLATGTHRTLTESNLKKHKVRKYFSNIVCGDEVTNGKPDPEIYLLVANNLGINPKNCLVIEDSPAGLKSAKTAGMTTIALVSGHNKSADLTLADHKINHLSEVNEILKLVSY
ncbi:MAG: hypothetical protein COA79_18275 [Planctomycetota bacterium]|nr:MAG: hypothetical protein COA79_18275 [Planctomycetota bacterium]